MEPDIFQRYCRLDQRVRQTNGKRHHSSVTQYLVLEGGGRFGTQEVRRWGSL